MSIGHVAEIGVLFKTGIIKTEKESPFGYDGLDGYGTLAYPKREIDDDE